MRISPWNRRLKEKWGWPVCMRGIASQTTEPILLLLSNV